MESDDDDHLRIPLWNQCLNYEFQIRKDAVRLCMEEGFSLKDALWHTLADKEHRMQHWILKLTIANARQESSKVHKLEQRLAVLEKQRKRSHSPRRQQNQRALPPPSQLALPSSGPQQGKKGKRQKGGKGKGKGKSKGNEQSQTSPSAASSGQGFRNSQALFKEGWSARQQFWKDTMEARVPRA